MSQLGKYLLHYRKDLSSNPQSSHRNQLGMATCNTRHGELGGTDRQIPGGHGPTSLAYVQYSRQIRYLISNATGKMP